MIPSVLNRAAAAPEYVRRRFRVHVAVAAIVVLFILRHVVTALVFPPFTGHDEVAHYGYLRTVAFEKRLPHLSDPLPPSAADYRAYALDWVEGPGYQYTALHPPLYYALMAPVLMIDPTASPEEHLYRVRLAGVWIGVLTVVLAFALAQTVFPGNSFIALTATSLVAFQPQVSYEAAILNNDALGIAGTSLLLWMIARAIREEFSTPSAVAVGVSLGIALLAKSTALVLVPAIALAILAVLGLSPARVIRVGITVLVPAAVISAPWYLHLYRTYGDLSGLAALGELQRDWNHPAGTFFELLFSTRFLSERFRETWGEFGWRRAPLDPALLWAIGTAAAVAGAGLLRVALLTTGFAHASADRVSLSRRQRITVVILFVSCVGAYLAVIQFGTRFVLTQARYFFPVVNAAAVLAALGFEALTPDRSRPAVQAGLLVALAVLNLFIYTRAVIPAWHFPR